MDAGILLLGMVLLLFGYAYYSTNSKRHKVLCFYRGKDKTHEEKWVSIKTGYVVFDNRKFDIVPRRITSFWMTRGIHYIFPTKANCLDYSWYSRWPHDPDNYKNVWETPEVRKAINKEEWVKSYAKGFTPPGTKKQGALQAFLPMIAIGLVVIVGFYLYSNMQALSAQVAALQNALNAITR